MAGYWNKSTVSQAGRLDNVSLSSGQKSVASTQDEFYEIEPGEVVDIILDSNHPYLKSQAFTIVADQSAPDVNNQKPSNNDPDLSWVGTILVRLLYSQRNVEKENLTWALPLEKGISEYPLLGETVGVVYYLGQYYYTRKINMFNVPNANADFNLEILNGGFKTTSTSTVQGNRELILSKTDPVKPFEGPPSKLTVAGGNAFQGALGRYFYYNPRIRSIRRHEGDLIIESRFGQSIKFGAYDNDRDNDKGKNSDFAGYEDYKSKGVKYTVAGKTYEAGGGNPMILIRNRQRPIASTGQQIKPYENLPAYKGTPEEKNVAGYIEEDINNDGTSIHITSGVTISKFVTNCSKKMWGLGEEQPAFDSSANFTYPKLTGDQIVINSDRVIISAKKGEMFNFCKNRYAIVTDSDMTIDAHGQIVFTTNTKTVLNSPAIYLGEYDQTAEPVLLGQTTINWLFEFCNQILAHTHWFKHIHPDVQGGSVGAPSPNQTQTMVQWAKLQALRDNLQSLASRRVFTTGGGFAPGQNGGNLGG